MSATRQIFVSVIDVTSSPFSLYLLVTDVTYSSDLLVTDVTYSPDLLVTDVTYSPDLLVADVTYSPDLLVVDVSFVSLSDRVFLVALHQRRSVTNNVNARLSRMSINNVITASNRH